VTPAPNHAAHRTPSFWGTAVRDEEGTECPAAQDVEYHRGSAELSDCGTYRYTLTRDWDSDRPAACFVMLNPSTADAEQDDPTIRRCLGYARTWGCGSLAVVNLYAYRAADPSELWRAADPVGPNNDSWLRAAVTGARKSGGPVVAAWGAHARTDRISAVLELPGVAPISVLALTKGGQPRHPLYLRANLTPQPWDQR
jgi:hypothetical protein